MRVANTIRDQIGRRALIMIGARNLSGDKTGLVFKIGRNPKRVNAIRVNLDPSDTYTVTFYKQSGAPTFRVEVLAQESDIYAEDLLASIERNTGLYTSLGTMGKR